MSTTAYPLTSAPRAGARLRALPRPRPELAALLLLAAVLYMWALSRNGWANDYYSAAVKSMSTSWHDFLYGSFDSSGVMTVDKPPLALWVQALSVRAFGFHALSILVPQALMGVASVALVYDLVRRHFGRIAGFAGGLALATTPITVAISRHNNPDALLVLCCIAALWFLVRGLEDGRTKWLVWSGVCVGLGFEAKMGAALMVVPGIAAAWVWVAPRGRLVALRQLFVGGLAMAAVGLAWPLLMALTPASDRPWISGTSDNSIWSLILGYNGLGRLNGQAGGPQAFGGGGPFGGPTGALRLFSSSLGGQAGWLLGAALVGGIGVLVSTRLRRGDARTGWIVAVGGSFLVTAVAFSFASGIFHPYYVSELAPFTAALVGAAAGIVLSGGRAAYVVAPLAVAAGVVGELLVLHNNPDSLEWLPAVLFAAGAVACLALAALDDRRLRAGALALAMGVLLIAPASWSVQTLGHATSSTFPAGGPATQAFGGPPGGFGGDSVTTAAEYVAANGGGTIGVSSQQGASGTIISSTSGVKIAALGGFSGRESQVSVSWFADAVRQGKVRWVATAGGGMPGPGADDRVGSSKLMSAVAATCKQTSVDGLYDCQGMADALEASS